MAKYPKHDHEYGPAAHSIVGDDGLLVEQLTWSQCRVCGAAEDERPDEAPDFKETVGEAVTVTTERTSVYRLGASS